MGYFSDFDCERQAFGGTGEFQAEPEAAPDISDPLSAFGENAFSIPHAAEAGVATPAASSPQVEENNAPLHRTEGGSALPAQGMEGPAKKENDFPAEEESEDEARKAHEAAEAKRKAEWEAKQQEKKRAESEAVQAAMAMSEQDALKNAVERVRTGTEKLTRRNMKECVSEYIQTKCLEDSAFARLVLHPRKSMVHCFQYINRKAYDYIQDELKASGFTPAPNEVTAYGCDIPDDLCYAWAEEYFRDSNAKEDQEQEEKFIPKPYIKKGKPTKATKAAQKSADKKESPASSPTKATEAGGQDTNQITLSGFDALGKVG